MRTLIIFFILSLNSYSADNKVIRIFTALCDNEHQGIVKVPAKLGDGEDLRNNLYWGAAYGIKTWFKKSKDWKLLETIKGQGAVLERLVFAHREQNVYLIAEAYKGSEMKKCLQDYFNCLAGKLENDDELKKYKLLKTHTKLAVFVGHNGLMDVKVAEVKGEGKVDAMSFCCKSRPFFEKRIKAAGSKSVLLTNGFMAPEAYAVSSAINGWLAGNSPEGIARRAASAYHQYQKCGHRGAYNLFKP